MLVFDIDLDFFLDCEHPLAERGTKEICLDPEAFFSGFSPAPTTLHVEHCEALTTWQKAGLANCEVWHFDAHADLGGDDCRQIENLPPGVRGDYVNSGNFLYFAMREGLISRLIWVLPPWLSEAEAESSLAAQPAWLRERLILRPWRQWDFPRPDRVDLAFSPRFTPMRLLTRLGRVLPDAPGLVEKWLDGASKAKIEMAAPEKPRFIPDWQRRPPVALYHGSPLQNLEYLRAEPLFLSPSPAVAACFGLKMSGGWIHGVDFLAGEFPCVYLLLPKDDIPGLSARMSLYRASCPNARFAGGLKGYELISHEACPVLEERKFSSAREALEAHEVYVSVLGRQNLPEPLAALARKAGAELEEWLEMPLAAILALEPLRTTLLYFFAARGELPKTFLAALPFDIWRRMLDRALLPICQGLLVEEDDWHGLKHARQTALWAAILAIRQGCSPLPAMLAACLHDCCRQIDNQGMGHGPAAAMVAEIFIKHHAGALPFSEESRGEIVEAIRNHAIPRRARNSAAAFLQDADRLRLAFHYKPRPYLFSTRDGGKLALRGLRNLANLESFLMRVSQNPGEFECKVELTNNCNLRCSFCHQAFGEQKHVRGMTLATFTGLLDQLAREKITMLRFTGGEPTLHPQFGEFLSLARERDFYITVNSNGSLLPGRRDLLRQIDCLKISLPAASETALRHCGAPKGLFERKLEAACEAALLGCQTEFLTPMFPAAIAQFEEFVKLFEELPFIRWLPLRAEAAPANPRPVSQAEMRQLLQAIAEVRRHSRWEELKLYLAAPFCLLYSPWQAARLLAGRFGCGPLASVAVNPAGELMRCYSRRKPLPLHGGIRSQMLRATRRDYENLPDLCKACPANPACLGGCRCPASLDARGFDALARPETAALWLREGFLLKSILEEDL